MALKLYAPKDYWKLTKEEKSEICNGCGAKGGIKVPDTMYGLDIKEACNIHDFMFNDGATYGDFLFSNAIFIFNLTSIIIHKSNWFTATLRLSRSTKYFIAVALKGQEAYWSNKPNHTNQNLNITYKGELR